MFSSHLCLLLSGSQPMMFASAPFGYAMLAQSQKDRAKSEAFKNNMQQPCFRLIIFHFSASAPHDTYGSALQSTGCKKPIESETIQAERIIMLQTAYLR